MDFNSEDAQTFLIQAELIHQKVKALAENKISTEQFDRLEQARAEDLRRRKQAQKRRQQQAFERKKRGRQGKGITKDFANFCKFCRLEYQLSTYLCLKCQRKTLTLQQRQKQLNIMVEDYKSKKLKRQQRKHKWEMWKKTQQMLLKKTNIHSTKWDYFVSDSEEEPQQEPIVPKNDPNFRALELDMEERKKRRIKDTQKAKNLKQKGNIEMKQGDYQKAMEYYTLALQHIKDIKSIYTNRALAYIKLKKYSKAIKDCTNVLEYMQVFEKIGQNKDLAFKAYTRRSVAQKQKKNYIDALNDVNQGLKLIPNDKNALLLKKQLEGFVQHTKTLNKLLQDSNNKEKQNPQGLSAKKQQKQQEKQENNMEINQKDIVKEIAQKQLQEEKTKIQQKQQQKNKVMAQTIQTAQSLLKLIQKNPIEQIKKRSQTLTKQQIQAFINLFIQKKQFISIFIASKGIKNCLEKIYNAQHSQKQALLINICLNGDGVGEKEIWDFGISKLYNKISQNIKNQTKININTISLTQDIFQILIQLSQHNKYRQLISNNQKTYQLIQQIYPILITKTKKYLSILTSFIIYISNLSYGQDLGLKSKYLIKQKFITLIDTLFYHIINVHTKNRNYLNLKQNSYSLISNLLTYKQHRETFVNKFVNIQDQDSYSQTLIQQLKNYLLSNHNFNQYISNILSIFVNLTIDHKIKYDKLIDILIKRYILNKNKYSKQIIYRCLLIISRVNLHNQQHNRLLINCFQNFIQDQKLKQEENNKNNMVQIVRILNSIYSNDKKENNKQFFIQQPSKKLRDYLLNYINFNNSNQVLFCNTCNLFSVWIDLPLTVVWRQQIFIALKHKIKELIIVAKQKTGNYRKNSAILLAKCAQNQQCKQQLYKEHGMDVLKSITHLVLGK